MTTMCRHANYEMEHSFPSGDLFLNLDLPPPLAMYGGEWGVSIRFGCIGRAVLPIDYTHGWSEQIELHTGRKAAGGETLRHRSWVRCPGRGYGLHL